MKTWLPRRDGAFRVDRVSGVAQQLLIAKNRLSMSSSIEQGTVIEPWFDVAFSLKRKTWRVLISLLAASRDESMS